MIKKLSKIFVILLGFMLLAAFVYGMRVRLDVEKTQAEIGGKYKTLVDMRRAFGTPIVSSIANINGKVLHGEAYVDRFIFPKHMFAVYARDGNGPIVQYKDEPVKRVVFYFGEHSHFQPLMIIEFLIRKMIGQESYESNSSPVEKLFPH